MAGYDTNKGAKCARLTRQAFGLDPDAPIPCLLAFVEEQAGIPVTILDTAEGLAGAYLRRGSRAFIFINGRDSIPRKRFSLAHEFGHHRLDHNTIVETWDELYADDRPATEVQANAFAAEFVAPKTGIQRWLAEHEPPAITLDTVCRLSAHFGLSAEAIVYRLLTIGVLPQGVLARRLEAESKADAADLAVHLGLEYPDDGIARSHDQGPRVPRGSDAGLLGALLRGETTVDEAASTLGRDPADLRRVLADAGIPA